MSIIGNIGGQSGGGSLTKSILIVTAPTGSTVTITKGSVTKTAMEKNGEWWFKNLENGEWTILAELDGKSATEVINITQFGVYRKPISYRMTPEFTYTGDYEIVQDDDTPIEDFASWKGNWKIRLLTSSDFTITKMHGFAGKIDVFSVGGGGRGGRGALSVYSDTRETSGGGGGAGGYAKNSASLSISQGTVYKINIGAGGLSNSKGGATSAFGVTADGGSGGSDATSGQSPGNGGDGGSGGGGGSRRAAGGIGGSDGANGSKGNNVPSVYQPTNGLAGKGQLTTTREFANPSGTLYASGGDGGLGISNGDSVAALAATPNTGNGSAGSQGLADSGPGGSGIVIIRNAREVAQ